MEPHKGISAPLSSLEPSSAIGFQKVVDTIRIVNQNQNMKLMDSHVVEMEGSDYELVDLEAMETEEETDGPNEELKEDSEKEQQEDAEKVGTQVPTD